MKNVIIFIAAVTFSTLVSATGTKDCENYNSYVTTGWNVHSPAKFKSIYNKVSKRLKRGLASGQIVADLSGPIMNRNTVSGSPMLLKATSWDDLKTDTLEMFGDIALYTNINNETQVLEVRWYDGKSKNIVINESILKCMTEFAPIADNSLI